MTSLITRLREAKEGSRECDKLLRFSVAIAIVRQVLQFC